MVKYWVLVSCAAAERYIVLIPSVKQFSVVCFVLQRGVAN